MGRAKQWERREPDELLMLRALALAIPGPLRPYGHARELVQWLGSEKARQWASDFAAQEPKTLLPRSAMLSNPYQRLLGIIENPELAPIKRVYSASAGKEAMALRQTSGWRRSLS
jgi:hypothetical protein